MAKIFLDPNDKYTSAAGNADDSIFGGNGTETVVINSGNTGIVADANVERVELAGATTDFTYKQVGTTLEVYSNGVKVADIGMSGTDTQLSFTNGTANAKIVAGNNGPEVQIGGTTVPTANAAAVAPGTIDANDTSTATGGGNNGGGNNGGGNNGGGNTGNDTIVLTKEIDNKSGGDGDDIFIGDDTSANAADTLDGGAGNDTLRLFNTQNIGQITNIENLFFSGPPAAADLNINASPYGDVKSVEIDNFVLDNNNDKVTLAGGQGLILDSVTSGGQNLDVTGSSSLTTLDLTLDEVGSSAAAVQVNFDNADKLGTLNIKTSGGSSSSNVQLQDADKELKTLNVSGDKGLKVDADVPAVALETVDASSFTGALNVILDDAGTAKNVDVKGGSGGDTANFGAALTKDDKFDGGAGSDTLEVTQASVTTVQALSSADKATLNGNLANLEILKVTDALTSNVDASRFDSINSFVFAGGLNNGGTSTLSKVTSGVMVEINDAAGTNTDILAVEIDNATLAGNNSDTVNLKLNDTAAGGVSDIGVLNAVGVDILNIESSNKLANGTSGTTTKHEIDVAGTSTALDKLVVTGDVGLDINGVALVNSIAEVDASGLTLSKNTSAGIEVAIATNGTNGVKITGSNGVDAITGGDAADIILGGDGKDTITGGKGDDQITGGAESDTFVFGADFANNGKDTFNDFAFGDPTTAKGDVLNIDALTDTNTKVLGLADGSANQSLNAEGVYVISKNVAIAGKNYGGADFAELFGAGAGQFNTTVDDAVDSAVIAVIGTDQTQLLFVDADAAVNDTNITAPEVFQVGVINGVGTFDADQFTLT